MAGMVLWFTDPLAGGVEPMKIPGVSGARIMLCSMYTILIQRMIVCWQILRELHPLLYKNHANM